RRGPRRLSTPEPHRRHHSRPRVRARVGVGRARRRHRPAALRVDGVGHAVGAGRQGCRPGPRPSLLTELRNVDQALRAARDAGRKLLVPYVTGGFGPDWCEVVAAIAAAGADAIEVGIPFSDPVMDGPTIQEASMRALAQGATPSSIVAELSEVDAGVPLVVMTYYNIVFRGGHRRFARSLVEHGVAGAIVPDLPLDEFFEWGRAADDAGVETILLAAPTTPDDRLADICARSRGFVYGVGVSTPEQAAEVSAESDGVIVGSALVRRLLEGGGPDGAAAFVGQLRSALDAMA